MHWAVNSSNITHCLPESFEYLGSLITALSDDKDQLLVLVWTILRTTDPG